MKKLTIKQAVKLVFKDHEGAMAIIQELSDMKSAMAENPEERFTSAIDNLHLLERVLKVYGAMESGSNLELKDEVDGMIYESLKDTKRKEEKPEKVK